ncbi:MAG TPA: hypothetical protein ENI99_05615 [Sedimenticola sp.]|nr:hypothetical protein [Sedimenticola sp.]
MTTLIRLILLVLLSAALMDIAGLRTAFFQEMVERHGDYAYMGVALAIAWLTMPLVTRQFDS